MGILVPVQDLTVHHLNMRRDVALLLACSTLCAALPARRFDSCAARSCALNTRGGGGGEIAWDDTPIKGSGEHYDVPNLLFAGMHNGGLATTAVGLFALAIKLVLAGAMVKTFLVDTDHAAYTWSAVAALDAGPKWGMYAAVLAAPAYLLNAMTGTSEFKDQAVFYATLRSKRGALGGAAYTFWAVVHALRSYVLLPLFVLANAGVMASQARFEKVLMDGFYGALILSIDDCVKVLYEKMRGVELASSVQLAAETKQVCDGVVRQKVRVLTIAQLALVVLLKTAEFGSDARLLWAMPVLSGVLGGIYLSRSVSNDHVVLVGATVVLSHMAIKPFIG